jgi:hypothetical protein
MKFFYVAMKYDPTLADFGADTRRKLQMETVRISFDTPVPFYPYFEPDPAPGASPMPLRLLDLWVIARAPVVPVSVLTEGSTRSWVRPMRSSRPNAPAPFPVGILDESVQKLIPMGPVVVQPFQDQKVSRVGFGDVLFAQSAPLDPKERAAQAEKLKPLLGILDPELVR